MSFPSLMELETMENALCLGKKIKNESDWVIWNMLGLRALFTVISLPILKEQGKRLGK